MPNFFSAEQIIDGAPDNNIPLTAPCIAVFAGPHESPYNFETVGLMDFALFITNVVEPTLSGTISNTVELADKVYLFIKNQFPQISITVPQILTLHGHSTILYIEFQAPYKRTLL